MSALNPLWMHVTWGAGGSTQERSLELAGASQGMGLETCLHLTCTNLEQGVLEKTLEVRCGSPFLRACDIPREEGICARLQESRTHDPLFTFTASEGRRDRESPGSPRR